MHSILFIRNKIDTNDMLRCHDRGCTTCLLYTSEIADGIMCYYSMAEKASPYFVNVKKNNVLKIGDEIIVQVSREGIKSKLPYVTSNLNFTGRYLVLTSERKELGFSGKLKKEEKKEIREILKDKIPENVGVIVRTNCRDAQEGEILHELEELMKRYEEVLKLSLIHI